MRLYVARTIILFISFLCITSHFNTAHAHNELVGELFFSNYENQLYVKMNLEKKHLTLALQKEGDCSPEEMLSKCGDKYAAENIEIMVNGKTVKLIKQDFQIEKDYVILTYKVDVQVTDINQIKVSSSYMLDYNSHAIVKAAFDINDKTSSYNLGANRKEITAEFK